jgi:hypothetical protein
MRERRAREVSQRQTDPENDQLVYDHYGLTKDEIAIVEGECQ